VSSLEKAQFSKCWGVGAVGKRKEERREKGEGRQKVAGLTPAVITREQRTEASPSSETLRRDAA
jgi:hypothetical protein